MAPVFFKRYGGGKKGDTEAHKEMYGFRIDQNESGPASMITYIDDNKDFTPAHMDYAKDRFDYGDWGDAWFIKNLKPCMLNYDGTVAYELDKDNYKKKIDGTASDIRDTSFNGNAMIGIPKVYIKIEKDVDGAIRVYFSPYKIDETFHCWSHIDNNGNEIDYCYMACYHSCVIGNRARSLTSYAAFKNSTAQQEIDYAKANNLTDDIIWYTDVYSDRVLIDLLLLLIGRSTNTQQVFGNGNYNSGQYGTQMSGAHDTKGLFYGENNYNYHNVKVFGIENYWGNYWRRIAGWISDKGTQKVKLTYGTSDGSTVKGYNLDGSGYISIPNSQPTISGNIISGFLFDKRGIMLPISTSGNGVNTYFCDGLWSGNNVVGYAQVGGSAINNEQVGAFCTNLNGTVTSKAWSTCSYLTCKPLAA